MTAMELIISGGLGALMLGISGYLFLSQARGYRDVGSQARAQAGMKKALQVMTRDIANAGGFLPNPRKDFSPGTDRLRLAYLDARGKYCAEGDTVTVTFLSRKGRSEDTLSQEIRCNRQAPRTRVLMTTDGDLALGFRYLDRRRHWTTAPGAVRAVWLSIGVQTRRHGKTVLRPRRQELEVQCLNL